MGSPWPWGQEPVKASNGAPVASIQNNNNNNNHKRTNYAYEPYSSYYNNQNNHELHHQSIYPSHPHHHHPPTNSRLMPLSSPPAPEQIISNEAMRKRSYPFYTFDGGTQFANNNNTAPRKSSSQQSQYTNFVKEIPTWNIYYSDQKHRIIDFTDKNNSIRPDAFINQLVSLCFVDTCITNLSVDAIVNSTTEEYRGTAGVDRLIHQHAGKSLREACKSLPRLGPGQAEMTPGFSLPAKYVIHTNGPLTEEAEQLTGCYVNSFNLLRHQRLRTIAFPCISTGKKGIRKKFAAEIALRTVRQFLEEHKHEVDRVIFCLHSQLDIDLYLRYMQIYFPVIDPEFHIPM